MIRYLISAISLFCTLSLVQPANARISGATCLFLKIQPDARFTGMGGAGSALADDAIAIFYNPAGITGVDLLSRDLNYAPNWLPGLGLNDMYYGYLSGVVNLNLLGLPDLGCLGVGITRLSYGTIPTTDATGRTTGEINPYEEAFTLSFGTTFEENLSVGANVKLIYSNLSPGKATGISLAVDFGLLYRNILPELTIFNRWAAISILSQTLAERKYRGLSVGISVANIGPDMVYIDAAQADPLPRNLLLGIGYRVIDTDEIALNLAIDYQKELIGKNAIRFFDPEEIVLSYGGEVTFLYLVTGRVGYREDKGGDIENWTWGFGIGPEWLRFNWSIQKPKEKYHPLYNQKRYSLVFNLPANLLRQIVHTMD